MSTFRSARNGKLPGEEALERNRQQKKSLLKSGEKSGILLATALFCYGIISWDIPMALFMFGFMVFYIHVWLYRTGREKLHTLSNVLKGFGITLLIGAVVIAFL